MLHMLGINIGHDGNGGWQAGKGTIAFICFHHHPFALPQSCVGAISVDNPPVDDRRVKTSPIQKRGNHRCGCGFAMRARNRHVGFEPHQFGQHLGPPHNRQAGNPRRVQFRIARFDRRRNHNHLCRAQIICTLPDKNRCTQRLKPRRDFAFLQI